MKFLKIAATILILCYLPAFAQTTIFTYQGKLTDNGTPQSIYEMQFKLFGSAGGSDQIGGTITNPNVSVNQGVFTVNLDFGAGVFTGADRFLQISVRRNASESFVTLNPRQQITSSPYSIRTLSAAQADVALDSQKLGGVDANQYVTTSSVGNSFIRNNLNPQQIANFNISGSGLIGGSLGIGAAPQDGQTLDITGTSAFRTANGIVNIGTPNGETGISILSGGNRADLRFNGTTLKLFAGTGAVPPGNGVTINTSGGATVTGTNGDGAVITARRSAGDSFVSIDATNVSNNSVLAFRKNNFNRWLMFANSTPESGGNNGSDFQLDAYNNAGGIANYLFIKRSTGNVGIGTAAPPTRLAINGGPVWTSAGWTGSLSMGNASALGWEANASGQRFGIGQSNGGLYFFRTNSAFGNTGSPANYDLQITDTGNITQARDRGGLVKAMIFVDANGTIVRCYNGITNSSTGNCGFNIVVITVFNGPGYRIDFGFQVNDRFVSLATQNAQDFNIGASFTFGGSNQILVRTFETDKDGGNRNDPSNILSPFMIIVY